jgi:hypothetical protein
VTACRRPDPGRTARLLAAAAGLLAGCSSAPLRPELRAAEGGVEVRLGGEPFTEYLGTGFRRPILWPLRAPGGIAVTRAFPMAEVAGEPRDHPHQQSLWFAHGAVNGVDFWAGDGRIVCLETGVDPAAGAIHGRSSWRAGDGREVCRDDHAITFTGGADWRAVDFDLTLAASHGALRLGDTKEGTFALRLRPEFCLPGQGGNGTIANSEGLRDGAAWGKRARWVAYAATVEGQPLVVAVFDHPGNPSHPTWWHARDYGLLAANPFGVHDFAGAPPDTGLVEVPQGGALRFRYRVLLGRGAGFTDGLDAAYAQWAAAAR